MTNQIVCSCGQGCTGKDSHEIMRRKTSDGKDVVLWSDGAITGTMGLNMVRFPCRSVKNVAAKVSNGRKILEWANIYTWAEVVEQIRKG